MATDKRFREKKLKCPYEHCIETMPLHEEEAREAVKKGMLYDIRKHPHFHSMNQAAIRQLPQKEKKIYKKIRRILDERGIKDEECWFYPDLNSYIAEFGYSPQSCRIYGHQCPGGIAQVKKCDLEGMFKQD